MKLTLRPEWRLYPLSSFLGVLDLKTGVVVALLFALVNKVAGIYGLIAVLTGAGGSFAQLSLYIYSALGLIALTWGLKSVQAEDPKHTLYFAHLFFADHVLSTSWTVFFAVLWWVYNPHDGKRQVNSPAQQAMMDMAPSHGPPLTDEERAEAARAIWNHEKGTAMAIIILSWLIKFYFAAVLYSYASHLRKGSYRSLPMTRAVPLSAARMLDDAALGLAEDEQIEDFYRVPLRSPGHSHHKSGGSISSMADFVSSPAARPKSGLANQVTEDDVLFDSDEATFVSSSSRGHSRPGTDEAGP
ncbi:DUF1753-domain-containing protein [Fistulina hepatica ATCC 64428]|uniref:DUF1753-domain-containing protein n=1 Tax=Fistulina hepatica ATCC 64428 TaxID=1128425 RepID=A0A0D7A2A8_9AGAR|nr:DUF1753-domain-containing protein [Fistulina hepatica ATCC 64428]